MVAVVGSTVVYDYFFREPLYSLSVPSEDIPDYVLFLLLGLLVAWFGAVRRRAEEILAERASLLDLTHDTVFVRNMNDGITDPDAC